MQTNKNNVNINYCSFSNRSIPSVGGLDINPGDPLKDIQEQNIQGNNSKEASLVSQQQSRQLKLKREIPENFLRNESSWEVVVRRPTRNCKKKKQFMVRLINPKFKKESKKKRKKNKEAMDEHTKPCEFRVGIRDANKVMSDEDLQALQDEIKKLISNETDLASHFLGCDFKAGRLDIKFTEKQLLNWLSKKIQCIKLWEEASLQLVHEHDLPKPITALSWIPNDELDPKSIICRLEHQNPGMYIKYWKIVNRQVVAGEGQTVTFCFDECSLKCLEMCGYLLFFNSGVLYLNIVRNQENEDDQAKSNEVPAPEDALKSQGSTEPIIAAGKSAGDVGLDNVSTYKAEGFSESVNDTGAEKEDAGDVGLDNVSTYKAEGFSESVNDTGAEKEDAGDVGLDNVSTYKAEGFSESVNDTGAEKEDAVDKISTKKKKAPYYGLAESFKLFKERLNLSQINKTDCDTSNSENVFQSGGMKTNISPELTADSKFIQVETCQTNIIRDAYTGRNDSPPPDLTNRLVPDDETMKHISALALAAHKLVTEGIDWLGPQFCLDSNSVAKVSQNIQIEEGRIAEATGPTNETRQNVYNKRVRADSSILTDEFSRWEESRIAHQDSNRPSTNFVANVSQNIQIEEGRITEAIVPTRQNIYNKRVRGDSTILTDEFSRWGESRIVHQDSNRPSSNLEMMEDENPGIFRQHWKPSESTFSDMNRNEVDLPIRQDPVQPLFNSSALTRRDAKIFDRRTDPKRSQAFPTLFGDIRKNICCQEQMLPSVTAMSRLVYEDNQSACNTNNMAAGRGFQLYSNDHNNLATVVGSNNKPRGLEVAGTSWLDSNAYNNSSGKRTASEIYACATNCGIQKDYYDLTLKDLIEGRTDPSPAKVRSWDDKHNPYYRRRN